MYAMLRLAFVGALLAGGARARRGRATRHVPRHLPSAAALSEAFEGCTSRLGNLASFTRTWDG